MRKILILLLLLATSAGAQVTPPFSFWKTSGSSFSPADIDSLAGWYVVADFADSLSKSTGDTCSIWPNRAEWLYDAPHPDLAQFTDANKPVYTDSSGVEFLKFDGINDFMQSDDNVSRPQPHTIFQVVQTNNFASGALVMSMSALITARVQHQIVGGASPLYRIYAGATLAENTGDVGDTLYVHTTQYNGASSIMRRNGRYTAAGNAGTQAMEGITISANNAGTDNTVTRWREYIVYDGLLSPTEIADVESYLATKYGITLAP